MSGVGRWNIASTAPSRPFHSYFLHCIGLDHGRKIQEDAKAALEAAEESNVPEGTTVEEHQEDSQHGAAKKPSSSAQALRIISVLQSTQDLTTFLARSQEVVRYTAIILTVLLNMILLCFSVGGDDSAPPTFRLRPGYLRLLLPILSLLHVATSTALLFGYFVLKVRIGKRVCRALERAAARRLAVLNLSMLLPNHFYSTRCPWCFSRRKRK